MFLLQFEPMGTCLEFLLNLLIRLILLRFFFWWNLFWLGFRHFFYFETWFVRVWIWEFGGYELGVYDSLEMVKKENLNMPNLSFNLNLLFFFWIPFFFIFLFFHFLFFYFYTHFFFISQTFPYLILLLLLFIRTQWFQFFKLHLWRNKFLLHFIPKQLFLVTLLLFFLVLPFDIFNIILVR